MSDLFHERIPLDFIQSVFATMQHAHWHSFQVLTKRPRTPPGRCGVAFRPTVPADGPVRARRRLGTFPAAPSGGTPEAAR